MLNVYVCDYVGEDKSKAPIYWKDKEASQITSIAELKAVFLQHQSQRTGRQWLVDDTRKAL